MATSPTIGIRLSADAQDLQRALNQGSGYIEGYANNARASLRGVTAEAGRMQGAFSQAGSSFAALAGGFAASAIALGFASKTKEAIDLADSFNKLSQKTGVAVEELSKLNYAAGLSDVSTESLQKGLRKLNLSISEAAAGSKEKIAVFNALGVSFKDASGNARQVDAVFKDLSEALSQSADGADKIAVGSNLMGKGFEDLVPMVNAGKKGLADMGDEAQKLGLAMGADFAKNAEEFNDNLRKLQLSSDGLFITLGGDLVKGLGDAAREMANAAVQGGTLAGVIAGIQTLLTGSDQYKNDKALLSQTELKLQLENSLLVARRNGNAAYIKSREDALAAVNAEIKATQTYRTLLQSLQADKARSDAGKPTTVSGGVKSAAGVIGSGAGSGTKGPSDYQRITDELDKQLALATAELEVNRKLTESEKYRIDSLDKITDAYLNGSISADQWAEASAKAEQVFNAKKLFEDTTRQAKADTDAADAHNKYIRSVNEGFYKLQEETTALQEHNDRLGLSKTAVADLDAAKLESQATIQDLIVLKKIEQGLDESQYDIYVKTARELRNQADLRRAGARKEQQIEDAKEVAKASAEEWMRGWEETDRLARAAFDDWGNMAQSFGKTLQRAIMSAIYDATVKPIALQIYTSIAGGAPGGAAGTLGQIGSIGSGINGLTNGAGLLGSVMGSNAAYGAAIGTTSIGAGSQAAMLAAQTGEFGAAGLSATASAAGTATGSVMSTIAAAGPYVLAAMALYALFQKGEYVKSTGSSVQYFDAAGASTSTGALSNNFATTEADTYVKGMRDAYSSLTKQLGATNAGGLFAFAANNSDGGKFGVQVGVGSANYSTGELKATPEAMALEASRAVFAALQGSELPKYLAGVFDGITATTATAEQINAALTYAQNIKNLHDQFALLPFQNLRDLSLAATKGLIEFSGGLDKLGTNLQGYYANFYDEGERQAQTLKNINATLAGVGIAFTDADIAAEDARKKFRALVESVQDLSTEADQRTLAALLSVQGAFADLTTEAKAATTAIDAQTDAQRALQAAWSAEGARLDAAAKDGADRLLAGQQAVQELRDEATQKYIDAQQRVTDAQRNLADVLHSTIKGFQDVLGDMNASAAPSARLATARRNFDSLAERARGGDTGAIAQLAGSAKNLSDLSEKYSATVVDFRTDQARIRNVLNEGIRAGNAQLALLPKDMQQATDPLKAAYGQLAQATADEHAARVLAIAMQASLTSTEKSLGDKYLEAIKALPDEKALKEFYDNTLQAAADAAAVAAAAAAAAVAILARMTAATSTPSAPTADTGNQTAGTKDTTLHGAGTAMFDTGDMSTRAGTTIYASDGIALANAYAQAHGKDAALVRMLELGGTPEMLDRLRLLAGPTASFAVGTNFVPQDMVAQIHKGEAIVPAAFNPAAFGPAMGSGNMQRLERLVEALTAEVAALRDSNSRENLAAITAAQQGSRVLRQWNKVGLPATATA